MEELIKPALRLEKTKALSPEEFQRLLYEYFEDNGIMSDLRAHLRTQMIKVLKDTSLGKTLINKKKDISPKFQAVNLLIAEYLLHKEYHYSLSVFSTEVPLNNVFPSSVNDCNPNETIFRFSENDMWDILETLGFLQSSPEGKLISVAYRSSTKESLLNCIIRTCNLSKDTQPDAELKKCLEGYEDKSMDIEQFVHILRKCRMNPDITLKIIESIRLVIMTEINKIKEGRNEELTKLKKELEDEGRRKLEKYKKRFAGMELVFNQERERLENELENAKGNLKECAQSLQKKYDNIKQREEELKGYEDKLLEKEDLINEKEKNIQKQIEEVLIDKINYKELKEKHADTRKVETKDVHDRGQQTLDSIDLENVLLRQKSHQLQLQVDSLRDQNASYLQRMQDMALRTTILMQQLENTQRNEDATRIPNNAVFHTAPVIVPTPSFRTRYGIASYSGGGEEGSTIAPLTPRAFRNVTLNKEAKRRAIKKQLSQSTSSEEGSPTETILKEAKLRLQNLEKESDQIDQQFEEYNRSRTQKPKKPELTTNSSTVLNNFQINLSSIRESLSRIFNKEFYDANQPGTSSQILECVEGTEKILHKKCDSDQVIKIKNLIAELPINIKEEEYEDVMNSLTLHSPRDPLSTNSSVLVLGTSISTVDVSPENKSDSELHEENLVVDENAVIMETNTKKEDSVNIQGVQHYKNHLVLQLKQFAL